MVVALFSMPRAPPPTSSCAVALLVCERTCAGARSETDFQPGEPDATHLSTMLSDNEELAFVKRVHELSVRERPEFQMLTKGRGGHSVRYVGYHGYSASRGISAYALGFGM